MILSYAHLQPMSILWKKLTRISTYFTKIKFVNSLLYNTPKVNNKISKCARKLPWGNGLSRESEILSFKRKPRSESSSLYKYWSSLKKIRSYKKPLYTHDCVTLNNITSKFTKLWKKASLFIFIMGYIFIFDNFELKTTEGLICHKTVLNKVKG